eukprot:jgi/Chlat1/3816/Chrsp26S04051
MADILNSVKESAVSTALTTAKDTAPEQALDAATNNAPERAFDVAETAPEEAADLAAAAPLAAARLVIAAPVQAAKFALNLPKVVVTKVKRAYEGATPQQRQAAGTAVLAVIAVVFTGSFLRSKSSATPAYDAR